MYIENIYIKMNFIWFLLVMLPMSTALRPCSEDEKPCSWRHFEKASLGNQALRPLNVISSHNVHLFGECHIFCVNAHNCYGYNFRVKPSNIYKVNCQLSNSTMRMNLTKTRNGPWIFYEDVLVTKDIDECSQDSHTCHSNATCTNNPGSYNCLCRNGYTGNGQICTDIDECLDKSIGCDSNANCINTDGSYKCKCYQGYQGNGLNCTDIDECSQDSNTCDEKATCANNPGSYDCQCRNGYTGNGQICTDIDECLVKSTGCDSNANCMNTDGSYKCKCYQGYQGNGHNCTDIDECSQDSNTCDEKATCTNNPGSYDCLCRNGYTGNGNTCTATNCKTLAEKIPELSSGVYLTGSIMAYCEIPSGWTLIARFSNNDEKNWMKDATFWYDKMSASGSARITSSNEDMISEAFWKTQANEIKITRSDDAIHTALLETTNNCLKGKTFREFITFFGNFRNQTIWANDMCLGNCVVKYGGQYQTTTGFEKYGCSSDIQSSNYIGFWCDWGGGDGAVMMIGGGGSGCHRADHGIGVTEENEVTFGGTQGFLDFGFDTDDSASFQPEEIQKSYALNLWVR